MKLNRKNKLLIGCFVAILFVCYKFAFAHTLEYRRQYKQQLVDKKNTAENTVLLPLLKRKEIEISDELERFSIIDSLSFQNKLLARLSNISKEKGLKIVNFEEPHRFKEKELKVSSYIFSVEGSFNSTLLLINELENDGALGFIKHSSFVKKMNYKTNTNYLVTDIILQKNESESIDRAQQ